jgi:uncharacterized iron-regulated membrane protein
MRWIFRLHGELLMGDRGSNLVELAACWTIVLLITGLFLWWPRNMKGLGGVLYPRLFGGSRMFWRDIHSVVGMWISFCAIFLLLTGLPWAKFWGDYFKQVRQCRTKSSAQLADSGADCICGVCDCRGRCWTQKSGVGNSGSEFRQRWLLAGRRVFAACSFRSQFINPPIFT